MPDTVFAKDHYTTVVVAPTLSVAAVGRSRRGDSYGRAYGLSMLAVHRVEVAYGDVRALAGVDLEPAGHESLAR